jgi:hypothetical protein
LNKTFDVNPYRLAHQEKVLELYEEAGPNALALYCACSFCPVLAAYWFCLEKYPNDKELTKRVENVKLFYGVENVRD